MGGSIFVGVRTADGAEHLGVTWTNWLPRLFAEPDLYTPSGGAPLRELLDHWTRAEDQSASTRSVQRLKRIQSSEYGLVLLDLKLLAGEAKPVLFESNGYFTPHEKMLAVPGGSNNLREDELCLMHLEAGKRVVKFEDGFPEFTFAERQLSIRAHHLYLDALKRFAGQEDTLYKARNAMRTQLPTIYRDLPMAQIHLDLATEAHRDSNMGPTPEVREKLRNWLAVRGWTSPMRGGRR